MIALLVIKEMEFDSQQGKRFFFLLYFSYPGFHSVSISVLLEGKVAGMWSWSLPFSAQFKNAYYTSMPSYDFMICCLTP
jgi:hypothetical protein